MWHRKKISKLLSTFSLLWFCIHKQLNALEKVMITLPKEASLLEITRRLTTTGVIKHPYIFIIHALFTKPIIPGTYHLPLNTSSTNVLQEITKYTRHYVRIPEGSTVGEILRLLYKNSRIKGGIFKIPEEGSLFPATYDINFEESRNSITLKMANEMKYRLDHIWNKGGPAKEFIKSPKNVVILASIVEKETGIRDERAQIAGVFLNRLKIGMPLQADPTVIYALTQGYHPLDRKLTRRDTKTSSPYNTYYSKGLPPTPIACPGEAALKAVLNPIDTKHLYFVVDGNGGHNFATTLNEHNKNIKKWKDSLITFSKKFK